MIKGSIIRSKILRNSTIFVNYVIDSYAPECPNYSCSHVDPTVSTRLPLNCCPLLGDWAPSSRGAETTACRGDQRSFVSPGSHERGSFWDAGAVSPRLFPIAPIESGSEV